jgi:diguanylate cyclase (GGDEF)-like protein/putative nucleotidyltransferase with HDIG domain
MPAHVPFIALLLVALAAQAWTWRRARGAGDVDPDAIKEFDRRLAGSRAGFDAVARAEQRRSATIDRDVALVVFDIDHLAQLNQDHGFASGDAIVALVQQELLSGLRRIDTILPLGGGSWAVLHPDADWMSLSEDVEAARERIQRRVARAVAVHDGLPASIVTLSVGYVLDSSGSQEIEDLLQAADQAALAAKLEGGNRTASWSDHSRDVVRRSAGRRRVQRDAQLATVLALAEALDLRDADTSNHSRMVGFYAELMAQALGMDPSHVERVRVAGLLHDIGKIGVPDSVLRKPGKLDDDEWAMMQAHPEIGARLLASVDANDIRTWVLAHHERPDGRGYPHGLGNDDIPIEAKILSVADAYEAMTADRVYRSAPGPEIARSELEKWRGQQFDGEVVDAFLQVLETLASGDGTGSAAASATHAERHVIDTEALEEAA